jgi:hypothetical protein
MLDDFDRAFLVLLLKAVKGMKESSTYQEIFREGFEKGMREAMGKFHGVEARAFLLRSAARILGEPDAATLLTLEAITETRDLYELIDRILDSQVGSWSELLGAAT